MSENKKRIVIVGGGIAGLSAGIYGKLAGYDVDIYEKIQLLADSVWGGTGKDAILTIAFIGLLERKRGQHSEKYGKPLEH